MPKIKLYHTGFDEIKNPDIHYGRANADLGQGFYTSPDGDFSVRWASERKGCTTYINTYELETDGLKIKRFERDAEWFDYIFSNRAGKRDYLTDYDVITGPIANDTIYDTWGIITSGVLERQQAVELLSMGPAYIQTVIKSERAVSQLEWLGARVVTGDEVASYRKTVRAEEEKYQNQIAEKMGDMLDFLD